jgi:hypothetical protein
MALTPYCSNDEVRAVLGLTTSELKDEVLNLPVYAMGLRRELIRVSPSLPAAFSTVDAATAPTELQTALLEAAKLFAVYAVAKQAGASVGLMAPKGMRDDKAGFDRFSDSPYRDVLNRVDEAYATSRQDLVEAYAAYAGATATSGLYALPTGFAAVTRSVDPVTGS